MAEQAGGGTGEQVFSFRRSGAREIRAFDRCGARVVRLATGTRAASGLRPGAISPCQELADGAGPAFLKVAADVLARKAGRSRTQRGPTSPEKRGPTPEGERRSRAPRGATAGVSGRDLWAFLEIGPTARRAMGAAFRTSACRRSAPSFFHQGSNELGMVRGAKRPRRRRRHVQKNEDGSDARPRGLGAEST